MLPFPFIFRIFWVMESPVMLPWHVSMTSRGASEGGQQGWTLNNLAVIQENWTVHLKAWAKAWVRRHVLTKPCWSHQLGEPQLCEPVLLCRSGTAMHCVPRQALWHNSTSFGFPAPSLHQHRKFSPQPFPSCSFLDSGHCLLLPVPLEQLSAEL